MTTMKTKSAQHIQMEIDLMRLAYRHRTQDSNRLSTYGRLHQVRPVSPGLFLAVYGTSAAIMITAIAALLFL